ncbi:Rho- GTP-binding protein RhoE, partial [Bulinus truncatus]
MKDQKCNDFVFMPLKDGTRGPSPRAKDSSPKVRPPETDTSQMTTTKEVRSKIVVVGSCGCGKTALINRYVKTTFLQTYTPTGFDTYTCQYSVSENYKIHMSIWDTS